MKKKLFLNKQIIASLNYTSMNKVRGGTEETNIEYRCDTTTGTGALTVTCESNCVCPSVTCPPISNGCNPNCTETEESIIVRCYDTTF